MHSSPRTYIADYIRSISNEGFSSADVAWASDWVRRGAFADSGGVSGTAAEVDNIEIRKKNMEASGFSSRTERKEFVKEADRIEVEAVKSREQLDVGSQEYVKSIEDAKAAKTWRMEEDIDRYMGLLFVGTDILRLGEYRVKRISDKVFRIVITTTRSFDRYQFDLKNITQERFLADVTREVREIVDLFMEE